jgi:hypothetical protein
MEDRIKFRRTTLPYNDNILFFHPYNLCSILSIKKFQSESKSFFQCNEIPKLFIGSVPREHPKREAKD